MGDVIAGHGGEAGGRKTSEPRRQWRGTNGRGIADIGVASALNWKAEDREEIRRWKAKEGEQLKQKLLN